MKIMGNADVEIVYSVHLTPNARVPVRHISVRWEEYIFIYLTL